MQCVPVPAQCPITGELFVDPVMAEDGYVYERKAIDTWFRDHKTSPMTNAACGPKLIAYHALREAIRGEKPSVAPPRMARKLVHKEMKIKEKRAEELVDANHSFKFYAEFRDFQREIRTLEPFFESFCAYNAAMFRVNTHWTTIIVRRYYETLRLARTSRFRRFAVLFEEPAHETETVLLIDALRKNVRDEPTLRLMLRIHRDAALRNEVMTVAAQ